MTLETKARDQASRLEVVWNLMALFDMDGVITKTAKLQSTAWKRIFAE